MRTAKYILLTVLLVGDFCWAHETKRHPSKGVTQDYVLGLSAADTFLFAWQNRDANLALSVVSSKLKSKVGEDHLRDYISGLSQPQHASFEIGPGTPLGDGRYVFEARLYEHAFGDHETLESPREANITVVRSSPERWLVDDVSPFEWE